MSIFELALTFFIMTNPIGGCPLFIALTKGHSIKDQQKILLRESLFALGLAVFFLLMGETFLSRLNIQDYALSISGGLIILIVSIKLIFSLKTADDHIEMPKTDPFFVPIATPLLSGAGLLTVIMLFSKEEQNDWKIFFALLLAWVGITGVLVAAPYLQVFLGKRGLSAMEQLMGMLLAMMGIGMIVNGVSLFLTALQAAA